MNNSQRIRNSNVRTSVLIDAPILRPPEGPPTWITFLNTARVISALGAPVLTPALRRYQAGKLKTRLRKVKGKRARSRLNHIGIEFRRSFASKRQGASRWMEGNVNEDNNAKYKLSLISERSERNKMSFRCFLTNFYKSSNAYMREVRSFGFPNRFRKKKSKDAIPMLPDVNLPQSACRKYTKRKNRTRGKIFMNATSRLTRHLIIRK